MKTDGRPGLAQGPELAPQVQQIEDVILIYSSQVDCQRSCGPYDSSLHPPNLVTFFFFKSDLKIQRVNILIDHTVILSPKCFFSSQKRHREVPCAVALSKMFLASSSPVPGRQPGGDVSGFLTQQSRRCCYLERTKEKWFATLLSVFFRILPRAELWVSSVSRPVRSSCLLLGSIGQDF